MDNEKKITKPEIPLSIRRDAAENAISNAVSEAAKAIPFFLIEGILVNIMHQVRIHANTERKNAEKLYNEQMEEYNKAQEAEKKKDVKA